LFVSGIDATGDKFLPVALIAFSVDLTPVTGAKMCDEKKLLPKTLRKFPFNVS
jgi:hypothetical protein